MLEKSNDYSLGFALIIRANNEGYYEEVNNACLDFHINTCFYHRRSVSIEECLEKDEKRDDLSKKPPFLSQLAYEMQESQSGKYWWKDQITDERIYSILKTLSNEELEILDLYVFVGYNQAEIAKRIGVSQATVSRKINEIFESIRKIV